MPFVPSYLADAGRYDGRMPYRRCGRSGLLLPAISLGLWHNFGGVDAEDNARAMLRRAFDLGITHFDLANNYGPPPGSAEECCGRILAQDFRDHRDELVISTKAGYTMWPGPYGDWGSRKYLLGSLDQSLRRLGLDHVDIFYSHRPDPDTPLAETMGALASAVAQGKAIYVGLSNYRAEQTRAAARILADLGTPCLIHQPSYSLFNRWIEEGLQAVLDEEGIGSIAFSPLAQGLLSNRYLAGIPADSRAAKSHGQLSTRAIDPSTMTAVGALDTIARDRGQTLAQMALAWVLRRGRVTSVLCGASRVAQLEENAGALAHCDFSDAELAAIDRITAARTAAQLAAGR
jgi:L-glyceraldehyde 3-phosphate reductase